MFLSVIIPVYNAEKYLERCVRSVLDQGLSIDDYEILLINDGSTDSSLSLCETLQRENPFVIHVFNKKNEGVSLTRQFGIEHAKGDYIAFCDADDCLLSGGYKYLKDNFLLNEDIDVLSFYSKTVSEENLDLKSSVQGKIVYDGSGYDFYSTGFHTFIWNHLYKRNYIMGKKIKFQALSIGEDVMFNLQLAMTNPRMKVVSARIYRYVHHKTSVMHNRNSVFLRKAINDYVQLLSLMRQYEMDFRDKIPALSRGLNRSLNIEFVPFLSRVFSSGYNIKDFYLLRKILKLNHVLPLIVASKVDFFILFIFNTYLFFPVYRFLYMHVFMKYIYVRINRER